MDNYKNLVEDIFESMEYGEPSFQGSVLKTYESFDDMELPVTEAKDSDEKVPVYVVCMHSGTVLANIIKKWTHDEFSHAAISFDPGLEPMYTFGRKAAASAKAAAGGFSVENPKLPFFKERPDMPFAIYAVFVNKLDAIMMHEKIQYFIRREKAFKYDFFGLTQIAFGRSSDNETNYFCSGFVADILQIGGISNDRAYSLYKPQDFADDFKAYEVYRGKGLFTINRKKVIENTKKIKAKFIKDHTNQ